MNILQFTFTIFNLLIIYFNGINYSLAVSLLLFYCPECLQVYGLAMNLARFSPQFDSFLRPSQPIKGLYLSGQDCCAAGICGALMGGTMSAIAIDYGVLLDLITSYLVRD